MLEYESIECELLPMNEYSTIHSEKKRFGRYHRTNFWSIKGYGQKKWVVCMRIAPKDETLFDKIPDSEIVKGCLNFLNTPPPRKKYAKKAPKPKYGNLELYQATRYSGTDGPCLSVLAIVGTPKNRYFWGKGKNV